MSGKTTAPPLLVRARDGRTDDQLVRIIGGKALNLIRLSEMLAAGGPAAAAAVVVPPFFAVTTHAFNLFKDENNLAAAIRIPPGCADVPAHADKVRGIVLAAAMPAAVVDAVAAAHRETFASADQLAAVRSSGTDEDSSDYSFAGQYESYLFQRGVEQVLDSLRECWASAFSARVLDYRLRAGLVPEDSLMGVVVQRMINSSKSGVAFSRHPLRPCSTGAALVSAVWGVGEGLVSGELDSDEYVVLRDGILQGGGGGGGGSKRQDEKEAEGGAEEDAARAQIVEMAVADKDEEFVRDAATGKLAKVAVEPPARRKTPALRPREAVAVARMAVSVEVHMGRPQDTEWAFEDGQLFVLQARPIPTLPNSYVFRRHLGAKRDATLWDNSNVVESYSGVTTPLTFSWAVIAYWKAYKCTFRNNGVPDRVVESHDRYLRNMLGLQRGHVYYNLMNWYRALGAVPLPESMRDKMMDDMMGIKQGMSPELTGLVGSARETVPDYGLGVRAGLLGRLFSSWLHMDEMVVEFLDYFDTWYEHWRRRDFGNMSMHDLVQFYHSMVRDIIEEWDVPPANDTLVMAFFGSLKKITAALPGMDGNLEKAEELVNDLMTGQDVKSFKPTAHLMRLATEIDAMQGSGGRAWFVAAASGDVAAMVLGAQKEKAGVDVDEATRRDIRKIVAGIRGWVDEWGFRCANELKLEEDDFFDDPTFLVDQLQGYLRSGKFDVKAIKTREVEISTRAETRLADLLAQTGCTTRLKYRWVLKNARRHVTHRENLRFARTQLWGVLRKLFRGFGTQLVRMDVLGDRSDVFYLTCDELVAYVEGRGVTRDLQPLADARRREFDEYRASPEPPERFLTFGPQGVYMKYPLVVTDLDLLRDLNAVGANDDPNVLSGKSCCPGVVEAQIRVVKDVRECAGMNGEILVTARTDPGWVTVYPMCGGILIERGSLLSHSAVVAREVGLPAIVSISGGLTQRLKTGMTVRMDGAAGTVTILKDENGVDVPAYVPPEPEEGQGDEAATTAAEAAREAGGGDDDDAADGDGDDDDDVKSACGCLGKTLCYLLALPFALVALVYACSCGTCIFTRTNPKRWEPLEEATAAVAGAAAASTGARRGSGKKPRNKKSGDGNEANPLLTGESKGSSENMEVEMQDLESGPATAADRSFKMLVRAEYLDPTPNSCGAWYAFFMERIPIVVYGLLTSGIVLSGIYTSAERFDGFGFGIAFGVGMLFLVLLRFMDEAKDIEKDKLGHPERPLPRGLVSLAAVTRGIYVMFALLLAVSIACFWLNTASGVSGLVVTATLWLMYEEFYCEATLDASPLLVAVTHQSIIFPLSIFCCCVANADAYAETRSYAFACVMLGSMLTYEICRKLDPGAHECLGTYLVAYGPCGVFTMVFFATAINVMGAVGLAFSLDNGPLSGDESSGLDAAAASASTSPAAEPGTFHLRTAGDAVQWWPITMLVPSASVVLVSLGVLFAMGSPGKTHKWVELFSILSLLYQWFAIPIAVRAGFYVHLSDDATGTFEELRVVP